MRVPDEYKAILEETVQQIEYHKTQLKKEEETKALILQFIMWSDRDNFKIYVPNPTQQYNRLMLLWVQLMDRGVYFEEPTYQGDK